MYSYIVRLACTRIGVSAIAILVSTVSSFATSV
jgi:hypothetical protein